MAEPPALDSAPEHPRIVMDILRAHVPDREVWAFGSRATGKAKAYSDLDLAVVGETPLPLAVCAALAEAFSESDQPWRVDVVDWAAAGDTFREIIERDMVVVQSASAVGEPVLR